MTGEHPQNQPSQPEKPLKTTEQILAESEEYFEKRKARENASAITRKVQDNMTMEGLKKYVEEDLGI